RSYVDAGLVQDQRGEADRVVAIGYRGPNIEGRARGLQPPTQRVQGVDHLPVTPGVEPVGRFGLGNAALQRLDRGPLNGLEDPGVDIGLELAGDPYELGVAADPAQPPTGHVVGLRNRMELESHLTRARRLQKAGRAISVERYLRIGCVVAEDDLVLAAELHGALEESEIRNRRGRVVRIVEPHQLRPPQDVRRYGFQV